MDFHGFDILKKNWKKFMNLLTFKGNSYKEKGFWKKKKILEIKII